MVTLLYVFGGIVLLLGFLILLLGAWVQYKEQDEDANLTQEERWQKWDSQGR